MKTKPVKLSNPRWPWMLVGFIFLIAAIEARNSAKEKDEASAKKDPAEIAENERWKEAAIALKALKQSMKNPSSFELVQALRMKDGAVCFTFRSSNSFNAIVPGYSAFYNGIIATHGENQFRPLWDKHCDGKLGKEIRALKYALGNR